jgi:L-ascorbate metabolism protein UlaG (beta-lactamase superfamily)
MILKAARTKDEKLVAEVEQYISDEKDFHLWWLGQSGFLLLWKGKKIVLDPYLSDSLTEKYVNSNKPHIRISERVIDPRLLTQISLVTSSHNHTDHLDGQTLVPLIKNNPGISFLIPEANRDFVQERISMPRAFPFGLTDGKTFSLGEFTIYGIPAKHNEIERDGDGNSKFMGFVIHFGNWTIYHSGDTLWFDGLDELVRPFHIDLALLPINGNDPSRGVAGNLDAKEAAELGKSIGARAVIPCHYDMFAFNTADPTDFEREAKKIGQPYQILELGGHFSSSYFNRKN